MARVIRNRSSAVRNGSSEAGTISSSKNVASPKRHASTVVHQADRSPYQRRAVRVSSQTPTAPRAIWTRRANASDPPLTLSAAAST